MATDPKRVQDVFLEAAAAAPDDRPALLDRACGGNGELRGRVDALLRDHDRPCDLLDTPLLRIPTDLSPEPPPPPGTSIGPYRLVEPLGDGGMGAVWAAEQDRPVERRVALKLIKPGMDSAEVIRRFEQERQALALMAHDNIARILDAGVDDRGRPYFVMELVEGVPVTAHCAAAGLGVRGRLELFVPVCRAVQHAHQKGVIHRDLKPSNVLVGARDGRPVPKVIDFGIAKAVDRKLTAETVQTSAGAVIGTLAYMSPEQAEPGGGTDVDTRADVYGLGALLYELLTGGPPLDPERLRAAPLTEALRVVREVDPPRPSARRAAALERPSPELDWVVMKCLEKDRTRRYDSAAALADDVERLLRNEPVSAGPPSAAYRARKFVRRNRGAVVAAGLLLAALVLGAAGTTVGMVRATAEREAATKSAEDEKAAKVLAERRLAQVEAAADVLGSIFADIDPRAAAREGRTLSVTLGKRLDRAAAQIDAVGDPLTVARLQHALGSSYFGLGYPKKAVPLLERAMETRARLLGARDPLTLASRNALGCAYSEAGRLREAVAQFEEVHRIRHEVLGRDDPLTLATLSNLAVAYRDVGRWADATRLCEEVHEAMLKVHGPRHEDTLLAKSSLAASHRDAGRVADALRLFQETFDRRKERFGLETPDTLRSMSLLAGALVDAGRAKDALPLAREAHRLRDKVLGPRHPETLSSMVYVAVAFRGVKQMDDAISHGEEALRRHRDVLGPEHPLTLLAMNALALTYSEADRRDKARPLFEEVHRRTTETLGADHPDSLRAAVNRGSAYRDAGKSETALPLFEAAFGPMTDRLGADHPDTLTCADHLAGTLLAVGQTDRALATLDKLVPALRARHGAADPRFTAVLARFGREVLLAKRPAAAEALLTECLAAREKRDPVAWTTFEAELLLGCSLADQRRFVEAADRLIHGYYGLKRQEATLPPRARPLLPNAAERLELLYDAWGKPTEAARWRAMSD